jgi:hypothetical protein
MTAEPNQATQDQGGAAPQQGGASPSFGDLAKNLFGSDYSPDRAKPPSLLGDDKPAGELEDEAPDQGDDQEELEARSDDELEADGEEPEADEEASEEAPDQGAEEADAGDEGETIKTMQELVEHLETDPEFIQGLEVDVVVDGNTSQVPLRDVIASYQTNLAANERLEKLKIRGQEAQQKVEQQTAALEVQFATAGKVIETAEQLLNQEFAGIDWASLEEEDPGLFSAKRQKMQERAQTINGLKQALFQQYQQGIQQRQAEQTAALNEAVNEARQQLDAEMPKMFDHWNTTDKMPLKKQLGEYALQQGFSAEELSQVVDWKVMAILEKARLYDQGKQKVNTAQKRIRKVPKVLKPGARRSPQNVNLSEQRQARAQLKKSGDMKDALAVMKAKRKAG